MTSNGDDVLVALKAWCFAWLARDDERVKVASYGTFSLISNTCHEKLKIQYQR